MRKLDRYIWREMGVPLFSGVIVIAMLFMANDVIAIFKELNVANIPQVMVAQLVLLKLPGWLSLTLPVGVTLGVSLALSRLSRENEITAMRAAGVPVRRVLWPVVVVGLLATLGNWMVVERLIPWSAERYREVQAQVGVLGTAPDFTSNVMMKLDRYTVSVGSVVRQPDGSVQLRDILAMERPNPNEEWTYRSKVGSYARGVWTLQEPEVRIFDGDRIHVLESKDPLRINEPIRIADLFGAPMAEEMNAEDLRLAITQARERGDTTRLLEVAYHVKFSLPASCLIFAITGAVTSIRFARMGAFSGVLISFGLVLAYYNIYVICKDIVGRNGWASPIVSAWLPNAIFLLIAVLVSRRNE